MIDKDMRRNLKASRKCFLADTDNEEGTSVFLSRVWLPKNPWRIWGTLTQISFPLCKENSPEVSQVGNVAERKVGRTRVLE